jgi:hypothetical protein
MAESETCERCGGGPAAVHHPRWRDGVVEVAALCGRCWPENLAELRETLAAEDAPVEELAAWLRTAGVRDAAIEEGRPLPELRREILDLLDELESNGGRLGRRAMCSACGGIVAERAVTIIPFWNDDHGTYVTTFRCPACLPAAIEQVRAELSDPVRPERVAHVCAFLQRHDVHVHQYLRGDPVEQVRPVALFVLDRLASRQMVLPMGEVRQIAP